jgi:putative ABC transport system ATP-binding protein
MLRCEGLTKRYRTKAGEVAALLEVNLAVEAGEFVVVRGASGSGKTTLLLALGGMLEPTAGEVWLGDKSLYRAGVEDRARVRGREVGFVFQMFHLVPYLSVLENVLLGGDGHGADEEKRASAMLVEVGLGARLGHRPTELSAGERQRTALVRALFKQPRVLLADEPTGNLDPENARRVMDRLASYRQSGGTVVLATHGLDAEVHATRRLELRDGRLCGPGLPGSISN